MGRMSELLTGERTPRAERTPGRRAEPPPDDLALGGEDVPFVEVGAPEPAARPEPRTSPAQTFPRADRAAGPEPPGVFSITFRPIPFGALGSRFAGPGVAPEVITFHRPEHRVSRQYQTLAADLSEQLREIAPKVLLFAGGCRGAGTSTVAANLAVTLAAQGYGRIALLEWSGGEPTLPAKIGLAPPDGGVVRETPVENLAAAPLPPGTPAALLRGLLLPLREAFDWVLIDASAELLRADPHALPTVADAVYLVWREGQEETPAGVALREELVRAAVPLRGSVITHA